MREGDVAQDGLESVPAHAGTAKVGSRTVLALWRGALHIAARHVAHPGDEEDNAKKLEELVGVDVASILVAIFLQLLVCESNDEWQVLDGADLLEIKEKE